MVKFCVFKVASHKKGSHIVHRTGTGYSFNHEAVYDSRIKREETGEGNKKRAMDDGSRRGSPRPPSTLFIQFPRILRATAGLWRSNLWRGGGEQPVSDPRKDTRVTLSASQESNGSLVRPTGLGSRLLSLLLVV